MTGCEHVHSCRSDQFSAIDYVTAAHFNIERCKVCGLSFTLPVPPKELMGDYYPDAYYGDPAQRRFPGIVQRLQQGLYAYRVWRMGRIVKGPNRRILDIGCGKGFLLKAFQRKGWTVQGIELSEHSARHAREVLGLNIHVGELPHPALAGRHFEAAVLWHVLEHSPEPAKMLKEVQRLLVPGGVLLVGVPNFGSLEARVSTSGWFHLDVPRHLVHFTRDSLVNMMEETGYEIISWFRFAPEFDLFSFVQSALNKAGLPTNHLYRMLRGKGAKLPGTADRWWHQALTLGLAIPLTLIGLLWIPLAAFMGEGSALGFLARKSMGIQDAPKV